MTSSAGSRHLVDPELLPLLDAFPTVTFTSENLSATFDAPLRLLRSGARFRLESIPA